jgi:hypothetical protein
MLDPASNLVVEGAADLFCGLANVLLVANALVAKPVGDLHV